MKIIYQSPNYDPATITDRYLHVDIRTGKPIVSETVKKKHSNYTYRSYELPESEHGKYSKAITAAIKIRYRWPNEVELVEDALCTN